MRQFKTVFGRLFVSVFLALVVFSIAMFLWIQLVHNNSSTLKNRAVAEQIAFQIDPFLTKAEAQAAAGNRLGVRFSLVVIKKSFDIFDESLNAKIGLYDKNKRLILETNNSSLPPILTHESNWLYEAMPTFSGNPVPQVQVKTRGYTLLYETRNPPPVSRFAGIFNLFTATLLLLLLMALVLWIIAKHITKRLDKLSAQMRKLGEGDFSVRVQDDGVDEIAMLAQGFNQSADKIEQLISANTLLLAHASHEFRTPITRMRLQVEMMGMLAERLDGADRSKFTKRADAITRDLAGLNDLIESILLVSRLDAGHALQKTETVDLYALVKEECSHYPDATLFGQSTPLVAQPKLLLHLVRNLLNNALLHGVVPIEVYVYGCQTSDETLVIPSELLTNAADFMGDNASNDTINHNIDRAPNNGQQDNNSATDPHLAINPKTDLHTLHADSINQPPNNAGHHTANKNAKTPFLALPALSTLPVIPRFKKSADTPAPKMPNQYAVLCVIDQGAGIAPDKRQDIFSPFVRLKQDKKGSGLGLSLVAQIADVHDGHIFTDTWQGKTRFVVVLPVAPKLPL